MELTRALLQAANIEPGHSKDKLKVELVNNGTDPECLAITRDTDIVFWLHPVTNKSKG